MTRTKPQEIQAPAPAPIALSSDYPAPLSSWRAWLFLVWFCIQHQARARQMVWISLSLLVVTLAFVGLATVNGRWEMTHWSWRWVASSETPGMPGANSASRTVVNPLVTRPGAEVAPRRVWLTYGETARGMELLPRLLPGPSWAGLLEDAVAGAAQISLKHSSFYVFSNWIVFSIFVGFLLPIWSLSFATDVLGSEREGRSLIWLLTRPLSRASIYLAKFVALLPWSLGLNLVGFYLLCLAAGAVGREAFRLYWPAVLGATLAFCALFHLMGALFRRPAIVALVYAFFLETLLGNMPGYMKRISVSFYTRCLMFDAAEGYGINPEKPSIYLPVSGPVAWGVLLSVTVILLIVGMMVFSRAEYQEGA
jgi:ABC-type transport system involved in multi-copper enzyme maturation permease subunit